MTTFPFEPTNDPAAEACERALELLIFGPPIDRMDPDAVRAWLDSSGVVGVDRGALEQQLEQRLSLYRDLVRERLADALGEMLPRTRLLLGNDWLLELDRFYARSGPRSPVLRELLDEWVTFATSEWPARYPVRPWLTDFIRYEALTVQTAARGTAPNPDPLASVSASCSVVRCAAARLTRFEFAVHDWDESQSVAPERRAVHLLSYSDASYELHWLELDAFAANLWHGLSTTVRLTEAVALAAQRSGADLNPVFLQSVIPLLTDWYGRGLLNLTE